MAADRGEKRTMFVFSSLLPVYKEPAWCSGCVTRLVPMGPESDPRLYQSVRYDFRLCQPPPPPCLGGFNPEPLPGARDMKKHTQKPQTFPVQNWYM